ncbi:hypothetical protein F8B43_3929 [Methylorubrum populi]|uniref:Uncharacterized protein n=1 Tax=Methylorubrum populi TaxID=223967 RepID=A0A833J644_9HYPH|nr:hypothetical protein F8B43_3929 [Methylorubrum populi]
MRWVRVNGSRRTGPPVCRAFRMPSIRQRRSRPQARMTGGDWTSPERPRQSHAHDNQM